MCAPYLATGNARAKLELVSEIISFFVKITKRYINIRNFNE